MEPSLTPMDAPATLVAVLDRTDGMNTLDLKSLAALNTICDVCFGLEKSLQFRCGHMLCERCDDRWRAQGKSTCPFCRQTIANPRSIAFELRYPLPDQLQRANDAGRRRSLLEGIKSPIERALLEDPELGSTVDSESDVEWEDVYDRADCHRVRASDSPDYERAPPGEDGAAPPLRFDDQGNLLADERPVYGTSGDGAPRRSMVRDSVRRWLARRGTSTSNS